jgi:hypothetical protein
LHIKGRQSLSLAGNRMLLCWLITTVLGCCQLPVLWKCKEPAWSRVGWISWTRRLAPSQTDNPSIWMPNISNLMMRAHTLRALSKTRAKERFNHSLLMKVNIWRDSTSKTHAISMSLL